MTQDRLTSRSSTRVIGSLILAAAVTFGAAGVAQADNDIGCGVGTMVMEGKSGVGFKILGSLTNGMTFNSISVTFGLINCGGNDMITAQLNHFTGSNLDQLAAEMSTGQGETLATLGSLLEIADENREAFYSMAQDNFGALFPSDTTTAGEMLSTLDALMRADARFAAHARS